MNIQFVRLDEFVCEVLNQQALRQRRTVSDLVNEILGPTWKSRKSRKRQGTEGVDSL
jgi:hypothetical protein